nr:MULTISPECIES: DUF6884 domain-containing protein [unclassified Streptomyces]
MRDIGWGPASAAAYAARCARYVHTDRLQLHARGRASVRLDFPPAAGRGPLRADAAASVAVPFGTKARRLDRSGRALRVTGPAKDVARYTAALPRVLAHAEQLGNWAARMYGACARLPRHAEHFETLSASGRRSAAAYFRALAYLRMIEVLTGPQDVVVPEIDPALPLWEQARTVGGLLGEYGWVEIRDAYDPAAAAQLLETAERTEAPTARWPVAAAHGEQLDLFADSSAQAGTQDVTAVGDEGAIQFDPTHPGTEHPAVPPAAGRPIVVIPCSATKLPLPPGKSVPAEELYQGLYFTKTLAAARAIPGGRVLILSGLHGLIDPSTRIATYDKRLDPRNINHTKHLAQATAMGHAHAPEVIALASKDYADAVAPIWPHLLRPLAGAGIGTQLHRLTRIAASDDPRAAALDYAAQAAAARP